MVRGPRSDLSSDLEYGVLTEFGMSTDPRPEQLAACSWPELAGKYDVALRAAVEFIFSRFDVVGIVACGSIIRGNPDPRSDFDLYVVNGKPFRQRIQRFFAGVPAEIFVNPLDQIRDYFEIEKAEGRPRTAHMLAAGFVVYQRDMVVEQLVTEAHELMAEPFRLSEARRIWLRYAAVDLLDNAEDLREVDADNAGYMLHEAVTRMLEYAFLADSLYLPRPKELLRELEMHRPVVGLLAREFYRATNHDERFDATRRLATELLGETTFFEWEAEPEQLEL